MTPVPIQLIYEVQSQHGDINRCTPFCLACQNTCHALKHRYTAKERNWLEFKSGGKSGPQGPKVNLQELSQRPDFSVYEDDEVMRWKSGRMVRVRTGEAAMAMAGILE